MAEQDNNPRNPRSNLFKSLTKLFSGPIVNYRAQRYRRERRLHMDKYKFTSASGLQFKRHSYDPFANITSNFISNQGRAERYADFDQMEYTPEIASAMDIYADEMTTHSALEELLKIKCKNEEIKGILHNLYHNILNVEFNLFGWCRSMCKFGDFFLYLDIEEGEGIKNGIGLPIGELERLEGEDKTNPNYVQYQWNSGGLTFENWQIAHFRILGNDKYSPYGTSILEPARRIWRQLILLEDAMMAYRIVRSPERRVFKIEVGNVSPQDVEQYMQKVMTQMKRNQIVDADSGRVDLRYNPLSVDEDYFIPIRNGVGSDISSLAGGAYTGDIDDVKYLRDKLFAALKVPQSYLSRGEGAEEDKATLAQKDIRFARTVQRLQRSVVTELEKIGIVHLYTIGFRNEDLISFKLSLNNPSKIAELQDLEHWRSKFEIASAATEGYFSRRWIATKLFNLSEEEYLRNQREMFYDRQLDAALEAAATEGEELAGGGELGLGGEELGGEELGLGDEEELGLGGEEELGGEEAAEEEGALLAAPGKRDDDEWTSIKVKKDGSYLKPGHKKWYKKEKPGGHVRGSRLKSMKHLSGDASRRSSKRNLFPGSSQLFTLSKGIYEGQEDNYTEEEKKIFENNIEIEHLISELENKNNEKNKKSS